MWVSRVSIFSIIAMIVILFNADCRFAMYMFWDINDFNWELLVPNSTAQPTKWTMCSKIFNYVISFNPTKYSNAGGSWKLMKHSFTYWMKLLSKKNTDGEKFLFFISPLISLLHLDMLSDIRDCDMRTNVRWLFWVELHFAAIKNYLYDRESSSFFSFKLFFSFYSN